MTTYNGGVPQRKSWVFRCLMIFIVLLYIGFGCILIFHGGQA